MCNKRSSDFRWAPEKDPTKEAKKAEKAKKLLKAEQKKRLKTEQKKQAKIEAKAARAQKRRNKNLEDLEKGLGLVFSKNFKGLLYNVYGLAYTMSALAICYFGSAIVSIFSADIISLGLSLWIGIVALIDAVGLWKILLPFRKIQPGDTKAFTGFLSLQKILNVISFVLCEIVAATLLTASIALMIASSEILDLISTGVIQIGDISGGNVVVNADVIHGLLSSFPSILFISGIFVSASAAVYFVFYNRAIKRFISYINELSDSMELGDYRIKKAPPYTSFIVFGVLSVLSSFSYLPAFDLSPALSFSIFAGLMFGYYLILTAELFKKLHRDAKIHTAAIDVEAAVLEAEINKGDVDALEAEGNEVDADEALRRGRATHQFVELCNLKKLKKDGVDSELYRLVAEDLITPQNAALIKREELDIFRYSDLLAEMCRAKKIYREYQIEVSKELRAELTNLFPAQEFPSFFIVDCIVKKKNGDLMLVDFKTDKTDGNTPEELIAKHTTQLTRYKKAIEFKFKKSPSSVEIYSFALGKSIPIQITK